MFNVVLVGVFSIGFYEELPEVNFDNQSTVVVLNKPILLRRRALVDLPNVTVVSSANLVRNTTEKAKNKIKEIVGERPIFPRANSIVKNIVTPKHVAQNSNEVRFEKKITSNNGNVTEVTETFSTDMIIEERRSLLNRNRFRIFRRWVDLIQKIET